MNINQQEVPQRVIVFMIDGMHWQAPGKLHMPVFNALKAGGTYIEKSYMILPHHPTVGEYGKIHTTSFPNPVLQEGTLFLRPGNKMLQDMFGDEITAFVANTTAYLSVSRGFNINIHQPKMTDAATVDQSIDLLDRYAIKYLRIHLQTPGNEGRYLSYTDPQATYYRNIWGEGSPYIKSMEEADRQLGRLVDYLTASGKMESTLLVVTSDHGQSNYGWHPIADEDSYMTPLLFAGSSIVAGQTLPYFEHTDLSPSIAALMGVDAPNTDGGAGQFIPHLNNQAEAYNHPQYIRTINCQINRYNQLRAQIMLQAQNDVYFSSLISYLENELLTPEPFYHQDRFMEWYRAGSTARLIEVNEQLLQQMTTELSKIKV